MFRIFFLLYILSLFITSISLFSSFLIYSRIKKPWFRDYINIICATALALFVQTIFYYIFHVENRIGSTIDAVQIIVTSLLTMYTVYFYGSLSFTAIDKKVSLIGKVGFLIGASLINICLILILFLSGKNLSLYLNAPMILLVIISVISLAINRKKIIKDKKRYILLLLVVMFISVKPLSAIEIFIRNYFEHNQTNIPPGIITFIIFGFVFYTFNTLFSIKILNTRIEKADRDDVPARFIADYSITKREKDVIEYLVKGYNTKDISEYLFISIRTVDKHIYNIYKKCNIKSRVDLVNLIHEFQ